jgi:uncharacterized protein
VEIPITLIAFSIPSILYIGILAIRRVPFSVSRRDVGWTLCKWSDILRALGIFVVLALISSFVLKFIPDQLLNSFSHYAGQSLSIRSILAALANEAFNVALGEEIFFRGFLGNWLFRRIGFHLGNLIQATIFLVPHLLLLNISSAIWPVFIVQLCAGWFQGWLLYRSKSIFPGWFVHTASNLASAISIMA